MTDETPTARDVLARRARELARPVEDVTTRIATGANRTAGFLVIRIGSERIGVELDQITEVHRTSGLTPIPGARAPVVGVIAWRGRVLTVLDIAESRTGPVALTESTRILVLGQRRAAFGVVADEVEDVQDVNMQDAAPVDDVAPTRREFIRGALPDALVLLDAAALIARFAPTH